MDKTGFFDLTTVNMRKNGISCEKKYFSSTCLSQLNFSDPLRPLQQKFFFGAHTLVKFWPKISIGPSVCLIDRST